MQLQIHTALINSIKKSLSFWNYWIFPITLIVISWYAGVPKLLLELAFKCLLSVAYAFYALLFLLSGVYMLVNIVFFIQEELSFYHKTAHCLILGSFMLIILFNVFPMVFWIQYFDASILLLPLYLILSNMLLYYYSLHTYREIHEEKQKLYVTSAKFKGATHYNYLTEKRQWVMLNNIRPMFYHLFSFTLFTDILVMNPINPDLSGIVGYIFLQLKNSSTTFSKELLLALCVSICILYPIKKLLEYPEYRFAKKHHIEKT